MILSGRCNVRGNPSLDNAAQSEVPLVKCEIETVPIDEQALDSHCWSLFVWRDGR
jgi:hypothetical protein